MYVFRFPSVEPGADPLSAPNLLLERTPAEPLLGRLCLASGRMPSTTDIFPSLLRWLGGTSDRKWVLFRRILCWVINGVTRDNKEETIPHEGILNVIFFFFFKNTFSKKSIDSNCHSDSGNTTLVSLSFPSSGDTLSPGRSHWSVFTSILLSTVH